MTSSPSDYLISYLKSNYTESQLHPLENYTEPQLAYNIGEFDFSFFSKYYLRNYFSLPGSIMHTNLMHEIQKLSGTPDGVKIANASPRGSAKSTITVTAQILWNICYEKSKYILLIKDTFDQAALDISGVKDELEENELILRDFGNMRGVPWGTNSMKTKTGILIQGLGAGMKIRGRKNREFRPGLVILDDIENDENTNTPEQRTKLERWFNRAVMKVGDTKTHYFFIGTILHHESLLSNTLQNPGWLSKKYRAVKSFAKNAALWDVWQNIYINIDNEDRHSDALKFYTKNQNAMLEGTDVLWPDGQNYYFLMKKRIDEGIPSFDSEFQNDPISLDDALFQKFYFYSIIKKPTDGGVEIYLNPEDIGMPVKLSDCRLFGSCDPSLGKTSTGDYSAIMVSAMSKTNRLFTLEADIERRRPTKILQDIFKYARKYYDMGFKFQKFAIESIAFQELFKDQAAEESMNEGLFIPFVETNNASKNKEARIESLEPDISNGYIMFKKDQKMLLDQLRYYIPKKGHDDGPDAMEMVRDLSRSGMIVTSVEM